MRNPLNRRLLCPLAGMLLLSTHLYAIDCNLSVTGVAFGTHNTISGNPTDSTGTISVTCSGAISDSVSYTLKLSAGNGSQTNRYMLSGSNNLYYNLYVDSGYYQIWGDGTGSTSISGASYTLTSTSETRNHPVYGRIPAAQISVPAGSYSDTLVVTVEF